MLCDCALNATEGQTGVRYTSGTPVTFIFPSVPLLWDVGRERERAACELLVGLDVNVRCGAPSHSTSLISNACLSVSNRRRRRRLAVACG